MDYSKFVGVRVNHIMWGRAKIVFIGRSSIKIEPLNGSGKIYTLSYPDAFFDKENSPGFLTTNDSALSTQIQIDASGRVCKNCGKIASSLDKTTHICDQCKENIRKSKNSIVTCAYCKKRVLRDECDRSPVGQLICKSCSQKRLVSKKIDFDKENLEHKITIYEKKPRVCENSKHSLVLVRANVLFLKEEVRVSHEIDIYYCEKCKKFFCEFGLFRIYENRFGILLLEKLYDPSLPKSAIDLLRANDRYASDSLLSRWGYIAQEKLQSGGTRRAILVSILEANPANSREIISLLESFIENRGERCPYAVDIWRRDLQFVFDYIEDKPYVDLTK